MMMMCLEWFITPLHTVARADVFSYPYYFSLDSHRSVPFAFCKGAICLFLVEGDILTNCMKRT